MHAVMILQLDEGAS